MRQKLRDLWYWLLKRLPYEPIDSEPHNPIQRQ